MAGQAGVAVAGGGKVAELKNSKGVVLKVKGKQIGLELAAESVDVTAGSVTSVVVTRTYREPRPHAADKAELAAHEEFLETISAPLWRSKA